MKFIIPSYIVDKNNNPFLPVYCSQNKEIFNISIFTIDNTIYSLNYIEYDKPAIGFYGNFPMTMYIKGDLLIEYVAKLTTLNINVDDKLSNIKCETIESKNSLEYKPSVLPNIYKITKFGIENINGFDLYYCDFGYYTNTKEFDDLIENQTFTFVDKCFGGNYSFVKKNNSWIGNNFSPRHSGKYSYNYLFDVEYPESEDVDYIKYPFLLEFSDIIYIEKNPDYKPDKPFPPFFPDNTPITPETYIFNYSKIRDLLKFYKIDVDWEKIDKFNYESERIILDVDILDCFIKSGYKLDMYMGSKKIEDIYVLQDRDPIINFEYNYIKSGNYVKRNIISTDKNFSTNFKVYLDIYERIYITKNRDNPDFNIRLHLHKDNITLFDISQPISNDDLKTGYLKIREFDANYDNNILNSENKNDKLRIYMKKDFIEMKINLKYDPEMNPFEFLSQNYYYDIIPNPNASTYLYTPYNIRSDGIITAQNIET